MKRHIDIEINSQRFSRLFFLGGAFFAICIGDELHAKPLDHLRVLATVSGRAITNRHVWVDTIIENPKRFVDGSYKNDEYLGPALERMLVQLMVLEESRVLATQKVSSKVIDAALRDFKKDIGVQGWSRFLVDFDLRETDLRRSFEDKYQVQVAVESRIQSLGTLPEGKDRERAISEAVNSWLTQLKTRYRVRRMRYGEG
jgi:hypothetical protein